MTEPIILRRYVLPSVKGEGWAVFIIGSDGYFSGVTDYGNAAYWWYHHGHRDFREFLLTAAVEWNYFMRKLFPDRERHDGEATLKAAKEYILRARWEKRITYEAAREAWDELVEDFEGLDHEWMYTNWVLNATSDVVGYYERSEMRRTRPDCHCKAFVTEAMARLAEVLRMELQTPRYTHDCDTCVFLGWYKEYDLYVHTDHDSPVLTTVVARYGSDGSEYQSGLLSRLPELLEAQRRATVRGILPVKGQLGLSNASLRPPSSGLEDERAQALPADSGGGQ